MSRRESAETTSGVPSKEVKTDTELPAWDWKSTNPTWSDQIPSGKYGKACVEKYCLLPPYDTKITEEEWKVYWKERAALDELHCINSPSRLPTLECQDISDSPGHTLEVLSPVSSRLAREVLGSVMNDEEKVAISRTLRGSLYMLRIQYQDDGDGFPRTLDIELRLYGPHGLGKSIDLSYYYHHRARWSTLEHQINLVARVKEIGMCNSKKPLICATHSYNPRGSDRINPGSMYIFQIEATAGQMENRQRGSTLSSMQQLEKVIIGRSGVMSMRKLYGVTLSAGSVGEWSEDALDEDLDELLARHQYESNETDGEAEAEADEEEVDDGIPDSDDEDNSEDSEEEEEVGKCVPLKLLELAKKNWKT